METVKVSVVVPVYNGERYLDEAVRALQNQTLRELEIICVDDGSTDGSGGVLDQYAKQDTRISVIHQTNQKQGAARNAGVAIAKGRYIGFMDCDDWVDPDYYEKLYDAMERTGADMACCGLIRHRKGKEIHLVYYDEERVWKERRDIFIQGKLSEGVSPCNRLYKRTLAGALPFKGGVSYEDSFWMPLALESTQVLVTVPGVCYHYRKNPASTTGKRQTEEQMKARYLSLKLRMEYCDRYNIPVSDKQRHIIKSKRYIGPLLYLRVKEYKGKDIYYLFGCLPVYRGKAKKIRL